MHGGRNFGVRGKVEDSNFSGGMWSRVEGALSNPWLCPPLLCEEGDFPLEPVEGDTELRRLLGNSRVLVLKDSLLDGGRLGIGGPGGPGGPCGLGGVGGPLLKSLKLRS